MKDYFNKQELGMHLCILACQGECEKMIGNDCISKQERTFLKYARTYLQKFNNSVIGRMGAQYERKLKRTLDANKIELVGKYAKAQETISECASEDLYPAFHELQSIRCADCKKTGNFHDCAVFAMGQSCEIEAVKDYNGTGCPFAYVNFGDDFDEE